MSLRDYTRANEFDRMVGVLQTENVLDHAVGTSILDVGCGIGEYTYLYTNKFTRVVGLDPSLACIKEARKETDSIEYVHGYGETFDLEERFDVISLNNVLEHVDDPIKLLKNCKKHLAKNGRLIVQVPNAESVTRRLGVLMNLIPSLKHMSEKEVIYYGHKRTYTYSSLYKECSKAGLKVIHPGGILYKPLPNEILLNLCATNGAEWTNKFIDALMAFGEDRPDECACIYCVCQ